MHDEQHLRRLIDSYFFPSFISLFCLNFVLPKLQESRYVTVKYTDDRCDKWNRFVRKINTDSINSCEKYMYYATRPTIS